MKRDILKRSINIYLVDCQEILASRFYISKRVIEIERKRLK